MYTSYGLLNGYKIIPEFLRMFLKTYGTYISNVLILDFKNKTTNLIKLIILIIKYIITIKY